VPKTSVRKITTKFQKCNQITTPLDFRYSSRGAKLPQNFKNAIKSQRKVSLIKFLTCAKLPQNFKNAIKSQRIASTSLRFSAQNYHKISKMQSNHNTPCRDRTRTKRKITTKFQKCNQITTDEDHALKVFGAKLPQNFKNAIKSQP